MKRIFIIFLILITLFTSKTYANSLDNKYLNVKLTKSLVQKHMVELESDSGFSLYYLDDKDNELAEIRETKINMVLSNNGIDILDEQNNVINTIPLDGSILLTSNSDDRIIKVEKDRYRDFIRLISKSDELIIINHVGIENYLYGVVPAEMPASFHKEALKAQAIASRSFALTITKHLKEGYDLCDTTDCQVYKGYEYENPTTNQVVDETRGMFAYYDGKIIEAIYHSTSSGHTEDSVNVWGGDIPYLKGVEDKFSSESPYSNWTINISVNEIQKLLLLSGVNIGDVKGIEIIDSTLTGKVDKVKIVGSSGEKILSGVEFRSVIGSGKFKSAWFSVKGGGTSSTNEVYVLSGDMMMPKLSNISSAYIVDGKENKTPNRATVNRAIDKNRQGTIGSYYPVSSSNIVIEGKGFGHGVGMSQFGAKKMGELGYSFDEILKYYYQGIEVR